MTRCGWRSAILAASLGLAACSQKIDRTAETAGPPVMVAAPIQQDVTPGPDAGRVETAKTPPIPIPRLIGREALAASPVTPPQRAAVVDKVALALSGPIRPVAIVEPARRSDAPPVTPPSLVVGELDGTEVQTAGVDPEQVRAPELFRASGLAQWNGQRTVRGVWVTHPRARASRKVRIVNGRTGAEIDATLYRPDRTDGGDVITVSSAAALALGLEPGRPALLSLFGLRPKGATSPTERRQVENSAFSELASHVLRMDEDKLLQLAAAALRGMGYATEFSENPPGSALPSIRARSGPDAEFPLPSIRIAVRPRAGSPMGARRITELHRWMSKADDLGVVVSVSGFAEDARSGLLADGAHLEMVDLDGLLNIWLTHYEDLAEQDRALLPLRPVYFLAES